MADLADVLTEVFIQIPDVPYVVATHYARQAAINFCEQTSYWRSDITITTVAAQSSYTSADYTVPTDAVLSEVFDGTVDETGIVKIKTPGQLTQLNYNWRNETGTPAYVLRTDSQNTLRLVGTPTSVQTVLLPAAWKPTQTATTVGDDVFNDFHEALAWGTLARLLAMPKKPWSDVSFATMNLGLFNDAIIEAKRRVENAFVQAKRQVVYGGI